MNKCTCGSASVGGGGHSSWCDSLIEPIPATLPAALPEPFFFGYDPYRGYTFTPALPAMKPPAKPTPKADGSHCDDRICACGSYIIKRGTVYYDGSSYHNTAALIGCSAAPKP